jgi:hypothetical protein
MDIFNRFGARSALANTSRQTWTFGYPVLIFTGIYQNLSHRWALYQMSQNNSALHLQSAMHFWLIREVDKGP